jgi:PEP-CTERM/exosortase A-associated glycosyltransferase
MTILHVLDHSLPEQSGYAYRSHAILRELVGMGLPIDVITGPMQAEGHEVEDLIDGVRYSRSQRLDDSELAGVKGQFRRVSEIRNAVRQRLATSDVSLIHAHSPCLTGLAALGIGAPLVYEMRSSWEDAHVSVGTTAHGSPRYRASRWLETRVLRNASAVTVICEGLRKEVVSRGVPEDKVTVVPNALPEAMFVRPHDDSIREMRQRLGLQDKKVLGFFGSFFDWEGVSDVIRVMHGVIDSVPEAHLLLAGGGRQEQVLKSLVDSLGLHAHVTFAGRVSHEEVKLLYGVADVMVFARVSDRLTEMVTPLKPLEAMAQNTLVVASDVGGHRELIQDGVTGILYPAGNDEQLGRSIVAALTPSEALDEIRDRAGESVRQTRRWSVVANRYLPVYERLTQVTRSSRQAL